MLVLSLCTAGNTSKANVVEEQEKCTQIDRDFWYFKSDHIMNAFAFARCESPCKFPLLYN